MISPLGRLEYLLFGAPATRLGRFGVWLQLIARYVYAIARDLAIGDLNLRAVGLVFTSLLSTVPLCAFSFSVLKGLGFHHNLAPLFNEFFRPLGDHSDELTRRVLTFVDHMKGGVVGTVGLAVLLWTAVSVVQKVEDACNHIWHVARPRSLGRRFGEYVGILVVGPIVFAITLGLTSALGSSAFIESLSSSALLNWVPQIGRAHV